MKKESRFLKYAIIMSLLAGGLCFGLSASAEDITTGGELSDANYGTDNTLYILNEIELRQGYYDFPAIRNDKLPIISNSVNIVVKGGGNRVYGTLYSNDPRGFETTGGASLTFNNVTFDKLQYAYSKETGTLNYISWLLKGVIAHSEKTAGSLNFNQTNFTNNTVGINGERLGRDVTMQIHGGLVNNNSNSQISDSSFSDNSVTSTASSESSSVARDHILTSEILGGAVYNTNQMNISNTSFNTTTATANINAEGNSGVTAANATVLGGALYNSGNLTISNESSFTDNRAIAQGTSNNLTLTAQGGALYNSGTANISGTTFSNNSVTATGGTAQGGAIYNAANAVINISNSTFSGNTANGAANDIYFAESSIMNVQQGGAVTINSGLASLDNTAVINIENGGNLVMKEINSASSGYTGGINIKGGGKLTFANESAPSLENASLTITENGGAVEYAIANDFEMTANNVSLANGVTDGEIIKSGSNTMTINGDFSDFSGQVYVREGILKYVDDDINDAYYNASGTTISKDAELIFDIAREQINDKNSFLSNLSSEKEKDGTFTKIGDGTLYMTGNNTGFTGVVNINKGTINLDEDYGATSDSLFGSDTINIAQGAELFSYVDLTISGQLKGEGYFRVDDINLSLEGDNSNLGWFSQRGGTTTVKENGSMFKNNEIMSGTVIFNSGSYLADGSTFYTSNSDVEILNNSNADSIIASINGEKSSHLDLDLILDNSNTNADLAIDGTEIATLTTKNNVTYGGELTNSGTGKVTNEGTLSITGSVINSSIISNTSNSTINVGGSFTNSGSGSVTTNNAGSEFNVLGTLETTGGTFTNNGTLDISGILTSNGGTVANNSVFNISGTVNGTGGTITNANTLTLKNTSDASGFTGEFTQTAGTTTVEEGGKVFGGDKNINAGSLTITSSAVDYDKVHLGSNAVLSHTSTGTGSSAISESVVDFVEGAAGAKAEFVDGNYTLAGAIENGNENTVSFDNAVVALGSVTDFTGETTYALKNGTTLDLAADGEMKDYSFSKLTTDDTIRLDINATFRDELGSATQGYMDTDTLTISNEGLGTADFTIGNIFIDGIETGSQRYDTGRVDTTDDVLKGNAQFTQNEGEVVMQGATTAYTYSVGITDSKTSIFLETTGKTNNNTLYDMNKAVGSRFFQFSVINPGTEDDTSAYTYNIDKSLSATAKGIFNVTGKDSEHPEWSILSGKIEPSLDESGQPIDPVSYENGSFFNIASGVDVELNIKDLTIQDAYKDSKNVSEDGSTSANGAVIENNSALAEITVDNVILQNNKAAGLGGAIYNNGGKLTVTGTVFTNNIAQQGGAIYNAAGDMILANVTLKGTSGQAGQNDIYNAGAATIQGKNIFNTDITNTGTWTIDAGSINTVNSNIIGTGKITNSGTLALNGDNSKFTGSFVQENGVTTVTNTFFGKGSTNTINNGTLNWATEEAWSGNLTVNDGNFNIGQDAQGSTGAINSNITLTSGSIAKDAATGISGGSSLTLDGEDVIVNLNSGATDTSTNDIWNGTVKVTNGTLNIDGFNRNNGTLVAEGGEVTLGSGSLVLNQGSSISEEVTAIVNEGTTTYINGGSLILNDELDEWDGDIVMTDGSLKVDNVTSADNPNGKLQASGGSLEFAGGYLELAEEDSFIAHNVQTNIRDGVTTEVSGGTLQIGNDDIWEDGGTIHLSGGTLDYAVTNPDETGILDADRGNLNLNSGSVLNIQIPSAIEQAVAVDIQSGALVNVNNNAVLNLDSATNDKWNGMIHILDGVLTTDGVTNATGAGGGLQQVSGSSTFDNDSHIYITDADSYIIGGDVAIKNNSSLYLGPDTYEFTVNNLNMENNSALQVMNGVLDEALITNSVINDLNNVTVDLDARHKVGDTFIIDNLKSDSSGILNVADFNFIGGAPVDREIKFQIFDADSIENVDFMATDKAIFTPIGNYKLFSQGSGLYTANLVSYNPQVFRGQAATLAMYNNQLAIDDIILNHVILHSERFIDSDKTANKYASVEPMFAPYQYKKEDGGLWFKSYVNFETLSMSQGLNVGNNAYGAIVGADFPVVDLKDGWKFLPTAFIAYNGSNQNFNHVNMYQNGGQGGFMGTFMKNDFIGSMMAYAGGYNNEMNVAGFNENNGNWFAGTAAKLAYNLHATKHFTIQPTAFISYNIFGKQSWGTDYGVMGMNSGLLNGINVAPGLNLIYARETWSLYGTIQYMFNINEQVGGQAGNVDLPNLNMRHGYLQYGIGATKTWKDRLNSYIQITIRNGGRTGIGFQLGLQYMFDWMNLGKNTKNSNAQKPKTKTILKSMK